MPRPTAGDVHVNRPLTNISVAYIQRQDSFVADKVFPAVPVQKQSDRYFTYDRGDFWRNEAEERAPGTESAGSGFEVDNTPTYYCRVYALHKDIDEQVRANTDQPLDADRDATLFLAQKMLIKRDKVWADKYFTTSVWTGGTGGATDQTGVSGTPAANQFKQWDASGSTPIVDVREQFVSIAEKTGYRPNVLVVGANVWKSLVDHADFIDRIKYTTGPAIVTEALVAQVLGLDKVVVAWATENTAQEDQTDSYSFIFGKRALLVYANPTPSLMQPSGGYLFTWNGLLGMQAWGTRMKKFYIDELESDRVEMEMAFDMKVVAADCGVIFDAAVA